MTRPRDLQHDDRITFRHEALSGRVFRVSDVEVTDIGITETVAVTLLSDGESATLTGATADSTFTVEFDGDEYTVFAQRIELV
jgi:hypothetical protein